MPHCKHPKNITKHSRIIVVMGTTGTGKSTFVNLVTGDEKIVIGHGTESKTDSIGVSCFADADAPLPTMIVDTPGFDDSRDGLSDVDILKQISEFLLKLSDGRKKLNGIIYMHRISDPRTGAVARKTLTMFKELCGEETLNNVLIVTTNWSRVTKEEGNNREQDLVGGFFKPLIEAGAHMVRHDDSAKGALAIMSPLLKKDGVTTKIVEELRDGKELSDTTAGAFLSADMKAMEAKHKEEMLELKMEMENAARMKEEELRRELAELSSKLDSLKKEQEKLKRGITRRFFDYLFRR